MNNIKTDTDVLEWAKTIVDANGEKYTPLSKGDIFTIAQFVVNGCKATDVKQPDEEKPVEEEKPTESIPEDVRDEHEPFDEPAHPEVPSTAYPAVNATRAEWMHNAGWSAQKAFDTFIEWCAKHPKDGSVMDFSNGQKSVEAAFSYWLAKRVTGDAEIVG